ncbi:MAG: hypothetical protein IPK60_16400 [Sandaracinaceae bacterium]|nr:hypothetical protein [Sandaracinaceae bacterium]
MTFHRLHFVSFCSLICALAACSDTPSSPGQDAGVDGASSIDAFVALDMPLALDSTLPLDMAIADAGAVDDAGEAFVQSYVRRSCGPADGPAFELALFNSSVPACTVDASLEALTFYVHDLSGATVPPVAGTVINSTEASSSGTANRCRGAGGPCESTETWTLSFTSYTGGEGAVGTYNVTWSDGSVSAGQFNANWCDGMAICG